MIRRILPIIICIVLNQSVGSARCDQYYFHWTRHSVSIIDKVTGQFQEVFADNNFIVDNGFRNDIHNSFTGRYISITCHREPEVKMRNGLPVPNSQVAVIIDLMNQDKWIIEDVEKVSWAPQSDLFVYIGGPSLNKLDYYYSNGAWLADPATRKSKAIFVDRPALTT